MTHMNTSFSHKTKQKYFTPRLIDVCACMSDPDTGEIIWQRQFSSELFGGSRSAENKIADIFASAIRGCRVRDSLSLSLTISPTQNELLLPGF